MSRLKLLILWAISWITVVICFGFSIMAVTITYGGFWTLLYTVLMGFSLIIIVKVTRVGKEIKK